MTENFIRIAGKDGNGIYGRLRSAGSRKLIIHVHGMTHSMDHMLEVKAAEYFTAHGFDHYRVGLYARLPDSRKLAASTLSTHVSDMRCVLDHFSALYDEIYVTAHSLGGLVMMILNPENVSVMSLWDPATDVTHFWSTGTYLEHMPERGQYQLDYGNVFVIGEAFVDEIAQYPDAACLDLAREISVPTQFVIPSLSSFDANPHISPKAYADAFQGDFDLQYIENAIHTFSNEGNPEKLFEATRNWFVKY